MPVIQIERHEGEKDEEVSVKIENLYSHQPSHGNIRNLYNFIENPIKQFLFYLKKLFLHHFGI